MAVNMVNEQTFKQGDFTSFIETQSTLPFGTIADIRNQARQRLELLSRDSGYVFAAIHNIQADISPDKIIAVFETAKTFSLQGSN